MPGWREKYDEMDRWHKRLRESTEISERCVDEFQAFFLACYHLEDWLKNDPAAAGLKSEIEPYIYSRLWLQLAADIANGAKHLVIDRHVRFDAESRVVKVEAAFDPGAFSDAFQVRDAIVEPPVVPHGTR